MKYQWTNMWDTKPDSSPMKTSLVPSYFEWTDKVARSLVILWEVVKSISNLVSLACEVEAQLVVALQEFNREQYLEMWPNLLHIWHLGWYLCWPLNLSGFLLSHGFSLLRVEAGWPSYLKWPPSISLLKPLETLPPLEEWESNLQFEKLVIAMSCCVVASRRRK